MYHGTYACVPTFREGAGGRANSGMLANWCFIEVSVLSHTAQVLPNTAQFNVGYFSKLKRLGFNPSNILDIGANSGEWTRTTKRIFPNASFFMIDAEPYHETEHWGNLLSMKRIKSAIAVLDDREHDVPWYRVKSNGAKHGKLDTGNSMFRENTGWFRDSIAESRRTKTLDGVLAENGQSQTAFEFIKIDVQGAELAAMRGGARTLSRAIVVSMEMPFFGQYNVGAPSFGQYAMFMESIGFLPFDITEMHSMPDPLEKGTHVITQVDMLFVRNTSSITQRWARALSMMGASKPKHV